MNNRIEYCFCIFMGQFYVTGFAVILFARKNLEMNTLWSITTKMMIIISR